MTSYSTTEDSNAVRCSCFLPASFCGGIPLASAYLLETIEWEKGWREPSPESRKSTAYTEYDLQANLRQSLSRISYRGKTRHGGYAQQPGRHRVDSKREQVSPGKASFREKCANDVGVARDTEHQQASCCLINILTQLSH